MDETSKLSKVKKELEANKDITIIAAFGVPEVDGFTQRTSNHYTFYVAPLVPMHEIDRLQELMLSLVPGLEPSSKEDFSEYGSYLIFGKIFFKEKIGVETREYTITLSDDFVYNKADYPYRFVDGKEVTREEYPVMRFITIKLFPNISIAEKAYRLGFNEDKISKRDLDLEIKGEMPDDPYAYEEFNEKLCQSGDGKSWHNELLKRRGETDKKPVLTKGIHFLGAG